MTTPKISMHRFCDHGALAILNTTGTVYFDAKSARKLAREAARLARSLERESFQQSDYGTAEIAAKKELG